jgi:hypothetical protein
MKDLIQALTILAKYMDEGVYAPVTCRSEVMIINRVDPSDVGEEDVKALDELGFEVGDPLGWGEDVFFSYRFA